MRKNYILDANVLLHDPQSVFHFVDNTVIIPVGVIAEVDRFKKEMTARGYNAREVVRLLDSLRDGESLASGITLKAGGTLKVYCEPGEDGAIGGTGPADQEILRIAKRISEDDPRTPVVIVSKDINLRVRADAAGLRAENYESDQHQLSELYSGHSERNLAPELIAQLKHDGHVEFPDARLSPNEYLLTRSSDGGRNTLLARANPAGTGLVALREAEDGLCGIMPRNKEQYFAIDALLDHQLQLVTLMGKAGTGKTLLAIAAAMHASLKKKQYRTVLVCRPIIPVGRDLGYLPGDVENKLAPWMKPVTDTVEFLIDTGGPLRGFRDVPGLIRAGLIEIQPLTYIRGRSIARRYVVIDEAQNLTPLEVKTIITRIGQDAKVVLTGDIYQIDNPYVDAESNGFTHLVNRFRSQSLAAHVELRKGERSPLAELAANLL
jgi:PhoH-like ATPase